MNYKQKSNAHKKWGKIVEGQIRDCMNKHPDYFNKKIKPETIVNSLAKRIVGEIVIEDIF